MSLTNSVDRRLTGFAASSAIPSPLFLAPLVSSLNPLIGVGTYTFARASIATMRDFGGIIRTCAVNEARFSNARRVENLLRNANAKSNNINDGIWVKSIGTETINGPNEYVEIANGPGNSGVGIDNIVVGDQQSRKFVVSFSAFKVSGTSNNYKVRLLSDSGTVTTSIFTLTTSLLRYSATLTLPALAGTYVSVRFGAGVSESGRVIHLEQVMVEDVTEQTNQNPSEYVSYGMGDDHGCGVDGVKWFSTTNGNTVASFVVTEASGTAIGSTGYLPEQEKTNLAWPSENLSTAQWTKNNINVFTTPLNLIGGKLFLTHIKALSTSDVIHSLQQSITTLVADEDIACAFFVAAGTRSHVFIRVAKGAESAAQFFNATTGAVESKITSGGTITVKADHAKTHAVVGGYWCHCIINGASVAGAHTVEFGISSTDGVINFAAANTTDTLFSMTGLQFQLDHEIGEYIKTVSGTITKAGDNLSYNIANIPGEEFAMVAECEVETPCASICTIMTIQDATESANYGIGGRNTDKFEAGASDLNSVKVYRDRSATVSIGHHKGGATFSRHVGERFAAVNGSLINSDHIDLEDSTTWSPATFTVGCNASGTGQSDFAISNVKIYPYLPEDKLQIVTA